MDGLLPKMDDLGHLHICQHTASGGSPSGNGGGSSGSGGGSSGSGGASGAVTRWMAESLEIM